MLKIAECLNHSIWHNKYQKAGYQSWNIEVNKLDQQWHTLQRQEVRQRKQKYKNEGDKKICKKYSTRSQQQAYIKIFFKHYYCSKRRKFIASTKFQVFGAISTTRWMKRSYPLSQVKNSGKRKTNTTPPQKG